MRTVCDAALFAEKDAGTDGNIPFRLMGGKLRGSDNRTGTDRGGQRFPLQEPFQQVYKRAGAYDIIP